MSPLHEPPSYNQAMKGAGVALSPPYNARARSLSESITVPRSAAMVRAPLKVAVSTSAKSTTSSNAVTTTTVQPSFESLTTDSSRGGVASPITTETNSGDTLETPGTSYQDVLSEFDKSSSEDTAKVKGGAVVKIQDEGDFARHVRGTSTPIDDISPSATPNQSHTFLEGNYDGGDVVITVAVTTEADLEKKRSSLRREDAVESPVATPSPEEEERGEEEATLK